MAYELRISDWSADVCSSDLTETEPIDKHHRVREMLGRLLAEFGDEIACDRKEEFSGLDCQSKCAEQRDQLGVVAFTERRLACPDPEVGVEEEDRKSTRLNSSH